MTEYSPPDRPAWDTSAGQTAAVDDSTEADVTYRPGSIEDAVAVGIGIRPGIDAERIVRAVEVVVGDLTVACLATLERRASDPAVRAAATVFGVPVLAFSAEQLAEVEVEHSSGRVAAAVGTASVAEAAALLAGSGEIVRGRTIVDGVVVAAASA